MANKKLATALKVALANEFVAGFATQSAHWNIEGINFQELHALFGTVYTDLVADIDVVAEHIRVIDEFAPTSIGELLKASTVKDLMNVGNPRNMVGNVYDAVEQVKEAFDAAFKIAEELNDQGMMDYLAGRIDVLAKHCWMLRVSAR